MAAQSSRRFRRQTALRQWRSLARSSRVGAPWMRADSVPRRLDPVRWPDLGQRLRALAPAPVATRVGSGRACCFVIAQERVLPPGCSLQPVCEDDHARGPVTVRERARPTQAGPPRTGAVQVGDCSSTPAATVTTSTPLVTALPASEASLAFAPPQSSPSSCPRSPATTSTSVHRPRLLLFSHAWSQPWPVASFVRRFAAASRRPRRSPTACALASRRPTRRRQCP